MSQSFKKLVHSTRLRLRIGTQIVGHSDFKETSPSSLSQLFILNEAGEHLSVHEELQELADSSGGVRFAEAVALKLPASVGGLDHV